MAKKRRSSKTRKTRTETSSTASTSVLITAVRSSAGRVTPETRSSAGRVSPGAFDHRNVSEISDMPTSSFSYFETDNPRGSDLAGDDKATQVLPQTPEGLPQVPQVAKTEKSQPTPGSIKRNIKATVLTFRAIVDRPYVARVQLLLCNISDRALHFKLKSNVGSNVSALPAASAQIAPHAQVRLVLTWTRPPQYEHWRDVPPPKLLIVTKFLDSTSEADSSQTSIRLIARVSSTKTCYASNPPVEQLLLDAVGKTENMEVSSVVHESGPRTPEKSHELHPLRAVDAGNSLADFLNGLTDRGLLVLILILLATMYIISRLLDKNKKK